eukprot:CAMPEP_0185493538 /NCGR_PEP_ID=MMETSP1366-20130426/16215_1 /TAXON_ID=38817 /ORGANISM="Gephyrocapsa oceanica, Strain RCC1303" /LENGTH=61 /DNA_ID=CAMNT_0028102447 /DNA_START=262 /DNA_END=444 /DNA_ORIENTATION=-
MREGAAWRPRHGCTPAASCRGWRAATLPRHFPPVPPVAPPQHACRRLRHHAARAAAAAALG